MKAQYKVGVFVLLLGTFFYSCSQDNTVTSSVTDRSQQISRLSDPSLQDESGAVLDVSPSMEGFQHGLTVYHQGVAYYLAGPPDGPDGASDIPGHAWKQLTPNKLLGKHFNTGPFGATRWWSSDAPDGALLYIVLASIDTWSLKKARRYAKRGYIHYHELVRVDNGQKHPTKVLWLKHIAVRAFTLDGGPHPELGHEVTPGVDWEFIPNGMMPYDPAS